MEEKAYKNAIKDKELKESIGDAAISLLASQKLINPPKDLKHLIIEFAYLFLNNNVEPVTMNKVITPKSFFKKSKIFYLGSQEGNLLLLNNNFTEETYKKIQNDMFIMHKVDILSINWNDYKMELY